MIKTGLCLGMEQNGEVKDGLNRTFLIFYDSHASSSSSCKFGGDSGGEVGREPVRTVRMPSANA